MNLTWIKQHPYAAGVVVLVGGLFLYLVMRGRQQTALSSGNSAVDPTLANIEAAASAQQTQVQGQIQIASINASVANSQTQAQLDAYKNNDATQVQLAQVQAQSAKDTSSIQAEIMKELFDTARDEQLSNNDLARFDLTQRYSLASKGVDLAKMGNRAKEGTNVVAAALGSGDIASYNQSTAAQAIASSAATASIISGLTKAGGGILTGLFA